jgi:2-oxoisovalerate dehydrogenase E2 component (dihydrolipoyl transacylase)
VKAKDTVQAFDPLCEVQSDKASVEITSPFDGVVTELLVKEGEIAKVGSGLCLIEVDEEGLEDANPAVVEPVAPPKPREEPQAKAPVEPTTSSESAPPDGASPTRRLHPLDPNNSAGTNISNANNVFAAPSVRHFARQKGIDLGLLAPGSGKGGRIEKRDVEAALTNGPRDSTTEIIPPWDLAQDVVVELGRTRYGMWKAMTKV